jgi:hypothetical protein
MIESAEEAGPTGSTADAPAIETDEAAGAERARRRRDTVEYVAVVILALASLATAWSGYQASRWSGVGSVAFGAAADRRAESVRASARANQREEIDILLFANYIEAVASGQNELATFYEARFRTEFRPAFEAWRATDPLNNPQAPASPFQMPEYQLADRQLANQLDAEADELFDKGGRANERGDDYVLTTVILAVVLFFAGISTQISLPGARGLIVGLGAVMLLYGVYQLATMPIE